MTEETVYDVAVIGSGPAGLTACLYAARARLNVLCIAGYESGGQLMLTTDVENYPGFPEGIQGPELMDRFRKQAQRFGTEFIDRDATAVKADERPFAIDVEDQTVYAHCVIVATGANARWLNLTNEPDFRGRGVSTCATCDGAFFRDQEVVVVGGGDSAMEEALFLTNHASKVTLVHRREAFRASKIMEERVLGHDRIDVLWNTEVVEYLGNGRIEGVRLVEHPDGNPKQQLEGQGWEAIADKGGKAYEFPTNGVFIAIGHTPNTQIFEDLLDMAPNGYLEVHNRTRTNVDGIFACGDVHDHHYRQAITAAGMGCMAAMDAEKWLANQGHAE